MHISLRCFGVLSFVLATRVAGAAFSQESFPPLVDRRAAEVRHLNMPYQFQAYSSKEEWLQRARHLREQILVSAGLWPMPKKTPLNPSVFGKLERGDYSIEKVYFESTPGFLVTGNLFRPLGKKGPFPGILSPHGHWSYGRLENSELGSIPARCITFARQGYVVFSYDMVGYNDSQQVNHRLMDTRLGLWGIGSLGLHLWNSIRSLDFLESLPDVDKERLACTGASGGGTQTFLLTAVDDRVKVSAPVNMISHYMQGGDVCENAPNLRLDTNNMEIGALMAPRPMFLVSAAGDWTRDTARIEFPAIQSIYRLFDAPSKVQTQQIFAEHNYNRQSREAVYSWFGHWLLGLPKAEVVRERDFKVEFPSDMLVFFRRALPAGALTEEQVIDSLLKRNQQQLEALRPGDNEGLDRFRQTMEPALRHSLAAEVPQPKEIIASSSGTASSGNPQSLFIGRKKESDRIPAWLWPGGRRGGRRVATLVVHPEGTAALRKEGAALLSALLKRGHLILSIDAFNIGEAKADRDQSDRFFTTYNRTDDANRVQDILTALAYLKTRDDVGSVQLAGLGKAGLWSLLARGLSPDLQATAADVEGFESENDRAYLKDLYIPLLRRAGDFKVALTLPISSKLLIHHTGEGFKTGWVQNAYRIGQSESRLRVEKEELGPESVAGWLAESSVKPSSQKSH